MYQGQPHFIALKARLLAAFNLVVLIFIPINIAKLLWVQPPGLPVRFFCTLAFFSAALLSLIWVGRGRLDRAGSTLVLVMILPIHGVLFFVSHYPQPLSAAYQLFVFDIVSLLLALVFSGRKTVLTILTVIAVSHFTFYLTNLNGGLISGTLEFAAGTLFRDGIFAFGFIFCLGIILTLLAEAAHQRSEDSLTALRSLNENLESLVAERTQKLQAETARANKASQAKGDFLANMSHEIRTPLNGILTSTDLLLSRGDLAPDARETARVISEAGNLLLKQVSDVLDFSKIESGQLELDVHPFDLVHVMEDIVSLLSPQAALGKVALSLSVPSNLAPAFEGDSFRLRQVLLNLVANAIKFTPSGAEVQLSVTTENPSAAIPCFHFRVRDNGIGIEASALKKIFERFSQARSSTSRTYGGSGLGLAISARLVELMGGKLTAESVPGQGSVFYFNLSFRALTAGPVPEAARVPLSLLDLDVLVAEDNLINRKLLATQLQKLGCRHRMVVNGQELLAALKESPLPDVILTDCEMPVLDGPEATRILRGWINQPESSETQHRAAVLPVIALTASVSSANRTQCLDAGMTDFLSKPAKLTELQRVLQSAVPSQRKRLP